MLEQIDVQLFYFINKTCNTHTLNRIMLYMTKLGGGAFLFGLALLLILLRFRKCRAVGILMLAGLTCSYHIVNFLKETVQRPRPFLVLPNINAVYAADGYSFPSTHAAMVFMAAMVFSMTFGKWYFFYAIAVVVGISRVYLGVHYPYDVFVGGCIGAFIGYFLTRIYSETVRN